MFIPDLKIIYYNDFVNKKKETLLSIKKLSDGPYIVRSSSSEEDTSKVSNAGKFESLINISYEGLEDAIIEVFKTYKENIKSSHLFIQKYLSKTIESGVIFTHNVNTGSPYITINSYKGNNTSFVTSGKGGVSEQYLYGFNQFKTDRIKRLNKFITKLLSIFDYRPLDIEYCITKENNKKTIWLLQVRPLILKNPHKKIDLHHLHNNICQFYESFKKIILS